MKLLSFKSLAFLSIAIIGSHLSFSSIADDEANVRVHVIANANSDITELRKQEVINIFMGGVNQYDVEAVALTPPNSTRVVFNTLVIGLTESRIQAYWAQMRFTGKLSRPDEVQSEADAIKIIESELDKIAYVSADTDLPEDVKIIYSR